MEQNPQAKDERVAQLTGQLLAEIRKYANLASAPVEVQAAFAHGMSTIIGTYISDELEMTDQEILDKVGALMFAAFCADAEQRRKSQAPQPSANQKPTYPLSS